MTSDDQILHDNARRPKPAGKKIHWQNERRKLHSLNRKQELFQHSPVCTAFPLLPLALSHTNPPMLRQEDMVTYLVEQGLTPGSAAKAATNYLKMRDGGEYPFSTATGRKLARLPGMIPDFVLAPIIDIRWLKGKPSVESAFVAAGIELSPNKSGSHDKSDDEDLPLPDPGIVERIEENTRHDEQAPIGEGGVAVPHVKVPQNDDDSDRPLRNPAMPPRAEAQAQLSQAKRPAPASLASDQIQADSHKI